MTEFLVTVQTALRCRWAEIEERGATAVEYAIVASLMVVGVVTAASLVRDRTEGGFNRVVATYPT